MKGNGRVTSMYGCGLLVWGRVCLRKCEWWCGSEEENGAVKLKMKKKKRRIVVSMEVRILVANEGMG